MRKHKLSILMCIVLLLSVFVPFTVKANSDGGIQNASNVTVQYRTHVQSFGWQSFVANGTLSGTVGQAKRLEGIEIKLTNAPYSGRIEYRTHVQSYGWQDWKKDGAMSGTSGQAKRLEAIQIRLTGEMAEKYDVYYRVQAQTYGWLGWAKNGEYSGTAGYAKRLEAIQVVLVEKNGTVNQSEMNKKAGITSGVKVTPGQSYVEKSSTTLQSQSSQHTETTKDLSVAYRTHVQSIGWQTWKLNGDLSGTSGQAKRLEGIEIKLLNLPCAGGIQYRTHVQSIGWQGWRNDGGMSGTSGQAKRLEAIEIRLTGELAAQYDVYYRVHAQSYGWLNWAKNGEDSGTAGYAKRLEAIQIVLVKKGESAPGKTYAGITSVQNRAYVASGTQSSTQQPSQTPSQTPSKSQPKVVDKNTTVYVPKTGKRYHISPTCSNMNNPRSMTCEEAEKNGYTPCNTCIN